MNLIKQKNGILAIAKKELSNNLFPAISCKQNTYFTPYYDSKHMDQLIMPYNSEFRSISEYLEYMWIDSPSELYTKEIMSAVYDSKDNPVGMLENIELFNYMM